MLIDEVVTDLLLRWDEKPSLTPEELCRDYKDSPEYSALLEAVQQGIHHLQAADSFLDTSQDQDSDPQAMPPVQPPGSPSQDTPAPWTAPGLRYRPLSFHAKGGLGEVFRAEDEGLHREVALKRIQERHRDNPESHLRFLREAEITAKLQHPGIVPVHGLGHDDKGQLCYAMRFIEGGTLDEALQRFHEAERKPGRDPGERSLALRELLSRFIAVCNTVAYAHSRGVLHRDLKPGNIMLGDYGETLVVDWGLAKPFSRTEVERSTGEETLMPSAASAPGSTQVGLAMGTPAYMSPEQGQGRWEMVGPASDIFSLGATLYALLTGQAPYRGRTQEEVLHKARRGDFPPPRQVKKDAPRALEAICLKAMAREPEQRYRTAKELAADVEHWLADEPVTAYREPWTARCGRSARRHKAAMAALSATILVVVLLGGAGAWWMVRHYAQQRQGVESALAEVHRLQQQARWAEAGAVLDQAKDRLGDRGAQDLREQLEQARRDLKLVARLDGIRLNRATVVEGNFDYARADREYTAAFQEAGLGQLGDDSAAVAGRMGSSTVRGALLASLDDWAVCAPEAHRVWVLEVARKADPDLERGRLRDPAVWNDGTALARLANKARTDELSPHLWAALGDRLLALKGDAESLLRVAQERYPGDFFVTYELGNALFFKGKPWEAAGYYQAALALRPGTLAVHHNLGNALYNLRRLEEAVAEYQKAIAINSNHSWPHNGLGTALYDLHRVDEAIAEFQKSITLDPKFAWPHNNLGNALRDKGHLEEAIAEFHKAIALDPKYAMPDNNLGLALYDLHRVDGAIAEFQKAIALDPKFAWPHNGLGIALYDLHRVDEAIAEFQKAIALDPKSAWPHNNLGNALYYLRRVDEAVAECQKSIALDPNNAQAHNNLGNALRGKGHLVEAVAECQKAIALDPKYAEPHINLGLALFDLHRVDEAIVEYHKAVALDPKNGWPHLGLGKALYYLRRVDEAVAEYHMAVALDSKNAWLHNGLGSALYDLRRVDEAIVEYHKAIALDPKNAESHGSLGLALLQQGRFTEARQAIQRCLGLLPANHLSRQFASQKLQQCEQMLAFDKKLAAILKGEAKPTNAAEQISLAHLCQIKKRYVAAVRFCIDAFAAQPKLADDLQAGHRYDAACFATLAAAGQGEDAGKLDAPEHARLRQQALDWLRADLVLWGKQVESGKPAELAVVRQTLQHWQADSDLAGVRAAAALAKLPEAERQQWHKLWGDVAALLNKVNGKK